MKEPEHATGENSRYGCVKERARGGLVRLSCSIPFSPIEATWRASSETQETLV